VEAGRYEPIGYHEAIEAELQKLITLGVRVEEIVLETDIKNIMKTRIMVRGKLHAEFDIVYKGMGKDFSVEIVR
jgi:hypothetical protein